MTKKARQIVGAVDIGGTNVRTAVATPLGRILAKDRFPSRPQHSAEKLAERIIVSLQSLAHDIGADINQLSGLGCSVPGPLDRKLGVVRFSPHLDWHDVPLAALFYELLSVPFTMDDDANCAALGEAHLGAARKATNMVYVTISTGIGAGIVIDGRIYRGSHGLAGEVGHIPLERSGPQCACGNRGCFEALASGTAMGEQAREAYRSDIPTSLRNMVSSPDELTAEHVLAAADSGDVVSARIVAMTAVYVGAGLAMVASAFDPEMIVLGGGVIGHGNSLLERARNEFAKRAIAPLGELVLIAPAQLGDDSALIGAAFLASQDAEETGGMSAAAGRGGVHVH
jgi:glucokinase